VSVNRDLASVSPVEPRGERRSGAALVLLFSVLFLLEIGIRNGELNQVAYLLRGLQRADPRALAGDWYTTSAESYHWVWSYLIELLARYHLLEAGLTIGTIATVLLFCLGLYALIRKWYERPLLPFALTLLFYAGLFTRGLGSHELLPTSVEPFGIAGVGLVCGWALLAWDRPVGAGISWGVAGLFHAHYAILIGGILAFVAVMTLRTWRTTLRVLIPFLLLSSPSLYQVLAAASFDRSREAFQILARVAPQHYYPWTVDIREFALFGAALAMGGAGLALRRPSANAYSRLVAVAALVIVGVGLLLGQFDALWTVNRAMPWRLSSFVLLVGLVLGSAALASGPDASRSRGAAWVVLGLALVGLGVFGTDRMRLAVVMAAAVPLLDLVTRKSAGRVRSRLLGVQLAVVLAGMLPVALAEWPRSHLDIQTQIVDRRAVYEWIRAETPTDAVLLVPPDWKDFRLQTLRGLIADWWATPATGADILQWYRRVEDLTGAADVATLEEYSAAYDANLTCQHVTRLALDYGVSYQVLPTHTTAHRCGTEVYSDDHFTVFALQPTAPPPS
jgi:hypothetical protein